MPTMCCTSCGGRREIADYLARLPLRCTGCGHSLVAETEAVKSLLATLVAPPPNGVHGTDAVPTLEYVSLSNAELSESAAPPAPKPVEPLESASMLEITPSQMEISIQPDRELPPLVVSEKFSGSSFQLPPQGSSSGSEEQDKSKLAERLKEIASLPAIELDPAPLPDPLPPEPVPEPELASPGQRFAARFLTYGLGVLAFYGGYGWLSILSRSGVIGSGTPSFLTSGLFFVPLALYLLIHILLLARRGQDVGKLLLSLCIRKDDGTPTVAGEALWRREVGIHLVPLAAYLLGLVLARAVNPTFGLAGAIFAIVLPIFDALFVFSRNGQCLHDRLAKTIVVEK
ncbi:MAG: RDD family protein [Gemmataceae bacterium]|nr:RDD family protein [Gemmataceae bacterium]